MQGGDCSDGVNDRFYSAIYRRLLEACSSPSLNNQLFSLLYSVFNGDSNENRVRAFVKRILQVSGGDFVRSRNEAGLQVALGQSASFAIAALLLVSAVAEQRPNLLLLSKKPNVSGFRRLV